MLKSVAFFISGFHYPNY